MGKNNRQNRKKKKTAGRRPKSLRVKIGACLIIRDEERFIAGCLDNLTPIVNEIVIVDTGSQDKTLELIEAHPGRGKISLYHAAWEDDFSAARNISLAKSTADWVFIVDADERLANVDTKKIRKKLHSAPKIVDGIRVTLRDLQKTKTGWVVRLCWNAPRLFRRERVQFFNRIHEQALKKNGNPPVIASSNLILDHLGNYSPDVDKKNKNERNQKLIQAWVEDEPENLMARYYLAQNLYSSQEHWEEGERVAEALLNEVSVDNPYSEIIRSLFPTIIGFRMAKGYTEEAFNWIRLGLSHYPDDLDINYLLCQLCSDKLENPKIREEFFRAAGRFFAAREEYLQNPENAGHRFVHFSGDQYLHLVQNWVETAKQKEGTSGKQKIAGENDNPDRSDSEAGGQNGGKNGPIEFRIAR